jgi:hypothetical protein
MVLVLVCSLVLFVCLLNISRLCCQYKFDANFQISMTSYRSNPIVFVNKESMRNCSYFLVLFVCFVWVGWFCSFPIYCCELFTYSIDGVEESAMDAVNEPTVCCRFFHSISF